MRVHSVPLRVTYHANAASCAGCCVFLGFTALIIAPYLVAYSLGGFFRKSTTLDEQPLVMFRHEALVEGYTGVDPAAHRFAWSTSGELNAALGAEFRPCELRAWSEDDNRDSTPDALQFLLRVPLDSEAGERMHAISLLVGLDVYLGDEQHAPLRLNSTIHIQHSSPIPGRRWRQRAQVSLDTSGLLLPAGTVGTTREPCSTPVWMLDQPVLPDGTATTAAAIMDRYDALCNDTVRLLAEAPLWTAGVDDSFELNFTVAVPTWRVYFKPSTLQRVQSSWVYYLTLLIPLYWALDWVWGMAVRQAVVSTRAHNPLKPKGI